MPQNAIGFGAGLDIPLDQIELYLAVRELAHARIAADVQGAAGAVDQDHDARHVGEEAVDVLHDRHRGLEQQLLGLHAQAELAVAQAAAHRHGDVDAQRLAALPFVQQELLVGVAALLGVDQPGVEALPQALDPAGVLVEAEVGAGVRLHDRPALIA